MNKAQLVEMASGKAGLSKKDTESALTALSEVIISQVAAGEKVAIPGFGAFGSRVRPARTGVNPATKAVLDIPEATVVRFVPASVFKDAVNTK
jgi:DNA-binding protein HU-beta